MTYPGQFLTDQAHSTYNAHHLSLAIFLWSHFTFFVFLGTSWSIELKRTVLMNTGVFSVTFYLSLHVLLYMYLNYGSIFLLGYLVNNDHYLCHWQTMLSNITRTLPSPWISIKNHSPSFAAATVTVEKVLVGRIQWCCVYFCTWYHRFFKLFDKKAEKCPYKSTTTCNALCWELLYASLGSLVSVLVCWQNHFYEKGSCYILLSTKIAQLELLRGVLTGIVLSLHICGHSTNCDCHSDDKHVTCTITACV